MPLKFIISDSGLARIMFRSARTVCLAAVWVLSLLALFQASQASAAMPREHRDRDLGFSIETATSEKDNAAKSLSGSPWPGVIDHLLQRPMPEEESTDSSLNVRINYPSIGHKHIDADIRDWVTGIANAFEAHLDLASQNIPEPAADDLDASIDRFLHDDDLNSPALREQAPVNFELWGSYKVSRPSADAISITFELWNYAGGQGNLDIITLNYSLLTGQRLNFVDIFEKPETALELMSNWSREKLASRFGATCRPKMLHTGTEPFIENFSSLTLTPGGVSINFQPWQVAPWESGIQKVEMPLEELLPSAPLLALWGR